MTDYQLEEIVLGIVMGAQFGTLEDAVDYIREEARDHNLVATVQGMVVAIGHESIEIYEESGTYYLRVMEAWEV